ncbi:hypothetical protein CDAR_26471 [Caerostris darwini]|uniref:Uncharacterized protein n=1 Tax=Caerostris darwini TaxID=1538125 RepID=A0AAV4QE61_9ARAC|nr:hypothetical protein CDAR_26471 [Caerostris darwini]
MKLPEDKVLRLSTTNSYIVVKQSLIICEHCCFQGKRERRNPFHPLTAISNLILPSREGKECELRAAARHQTPRIGKFNVTHCRKGFKQRGVGFDHPPRQFGVTFPSLLLIRTSTGEEEMDKFKPDQNPWSTYTLCPHSPIPFRAGDLIQCYELPMRHDPISP